MTQDLLLLLERHPFLVGGGDVRFCRASVGSLQLKGAGVTLTGLGLSRAVAVRLMSEPR